MLRSTSGFIYSLYDGAFPKILLPLLLSQATTVRRASLFPMWLPARDQEEPWREITAGQRSDRPPFPGPSAGAGGGTRGPGGLMCVRGSTIRYIKQRVSVGEGKFVFQLRHRAGNTSESKRLHSCDQL